MKINVKAFALACGITWGVAMLFLGIINIFCDWGSGIEEVMSTLYIGYSATVPGSIIGGIWGFIDAGIGGLLIAWLYNKLAK